MLARKITNVLLARLEAYPAVALVGPRQCGKTTLARSLGGRYFDLEQDSDKLRLDIQWNEIIAGTELVVLDEAQVWPDLFSRLRGAIDSNRKQYGRFLLLGSVSPFLMTRVSESLAGRLSVIELSPFVQPELANSTQQDILWLCGGYPDGGVLSGQGFPRLANGLPEFAFSTRSSQLGNDGSATDNAKTASYACGEPWSGMECQPGRKKPGFVLPYSQWLS